MAAVQEARTPEQAAQILELLLSVPLAIFSIVAFTYGILGFYVLLYIASLYVLSINRREKRYTAFHIVSSTVLFLLVTGLVICRLVSEGVGLVGLLMYILSPMFDPSTNLDLSRQFQEAGFWMFTLTNTMAEIILIHRTWIVWGHIKKIIIIPVLLMTANLALGIIGHLLTKLRVTQTTEDDLKVSASILFSGVFMGVNILTNVLLTGLIAGRIWYISRMNRIIGGESRKRYSALIAIILESGALYPLFLIANIILSFGQFPAKDRLNVAHAEGIVSDLLGIIAAIAPTLIIVRAGLGVSIEQVNTSSSSSQPYVPVSTFRAANSENRAPPTTLSLHARSSSYPSVWSRDSWRGTEGSQGGQVDYLGVPIGNEKFDDSVFSYHYRRSIGVAR